MHLAISNLAWDENHDFYYALMQQYGITGLEIAPTKWSSAPYDHIELAQKIQTDIFAQYQPNVWATFVPF